MRDDASTGVPPTTSVRPARPAAPGAPAVDARFGVDQVHRIRFTSDVFDPANAVLADVLRTAGDEPRRAVVFVDDGVAAATPGLPARIAAWADAHRDRLDLVDDVHTVVGGEAAKNDWSVYEQVVETIHRAGICRHSFVLVIGGGAVLDAVGFGAATAHRGVRLIRFPTTTLAQDDAGIGVKNGINAFGKKNFLGSFGVPWAVINDERFLTTLSDRDWRAGLSEAVKVALLKDAPYFERIERAAPALRGRDQAAVVPIVHRSAELHLDHIARGGDPYELLNARPLDFGHWAAHRIEPMSAYRVRHGEAVAIGIALDCLYAREIGVLGADDCERVVACLEGIGFDLWDDVMADTDALLEGLTEFREHLGGELTITLLEAPGRPIDVHTIDHAVMERALHALRDRAAT